MFVRGVDTVQDIAFRNAVKDMHWCLEQISVQAFFEVEPFCLCCFWKTVNTPTKSIVTNWCPENCVFGETKVKFSGLLIQINKGYAEVRPKFIPGRGPNDVRNHRSDEPLEIYHGEFMTDNFQRRGQLMVSQSFHRASKYWLLNFKLSVKKVQPLVLWLFWNANWKTSTVCILLSFLSPSSPPSYYHLLRLVSGWNSRVFISGKQQIYIVYWEHVVHVVLDVQRVFTFLPRDHMRATGCTVVLHSAELNILWTATASFPDCFL